VGLGSRIAVYNVASAPEGQKTETAMKEGGGLGGAIAGGELGAEIGSVAGPWGAAIGGVLGSIAGGYLGKDAVERVLKSPNDETNIPNASQR